MKKYVIIFKGSRKNKTIECDYLVHTDESFMFRKNDMIVFSIHPRLVDTVELQD